MRVLKVRFKESDHKNYSVFSMEYKGWFGWKRNKVKLHDVYGGFVYDEIYGLTKEECIDRNLRHMKLKKENIRLIEFSTVKIN